MPAMWDHSAANAPASDTAGGVGAPEDEADEYEDEQFDSRHESSDDSDGEQEAKRGAGGVSGLATTGPPTTSASGKPTLRQASGESEYNDEEFEEDTSVPPPPVVPAVPAFRPVARHGSRRDVLPKEGGL